MTEFYATSFNNVSERDARQKVYILIGWLVYCLMAMSTQNNHTYSTIKKTNRPTSNKHQHTKNKSGLCINNILELLEIQETRSFQPIPWLWWCLPNLCHSFRCQYSTQYKFANSFSHLQ